MFAIALVGVVLSLGACSPAGLSAESVSAAPATSTPASAAPSTRETPTSGTPATPSAESSLAPGPSASEVATMHPQPFGITSTAFEDGTAIPRRFTCDGENLSPDLAWDGAPEGTKSLVLVVTDPDARDFVHWLAYDLTGVPSGGLPRGASASPAAPRQGANSFGKRGYGGPCPPSGTHHYRFTLSALDTVLPLSGTPSLGALEAAMDGHVLAKATLTGTYRRS
jgi:hypothetical protein